jgi:hypothetical protein
MITRADGRGGSTPPRPAAPDSTPGQCFVFKPWLYDVDAPVGCCAPCHAPRNRSRSWTGHARTV